MQQIQHRQGYATVPYTGAADPWKPMDPTGGTGGLEVKGIFRYLPGNAEGLTFYTPGSGKPGTLNTRMEKTVKGVRYKVDSRFTGEGNFREIFENALAGRLLKQE